MWVGAPAERLVLGWLAVTLFVLCFGLIAVYLCCHLHNIGIVSPKDGEGIYARAWLILVDRVLLKSNNAIYSFWVTYGGITQPKTNICKKSLKTQKHAQLRVSQ